MNMIIDLAAIAFFLLAFGALLLQVYLLGMAWNFSRNGYKNVRMGMGPTLLFMLFALVGFGLILL